MSFLTQDELYTLGKDGTKVPITGYTFGKDGIIVPIDGNSYNLGKDGTIIPKPGYTIGKGGILVKIQTTSSDSSYAASFFKSDKTLPPQMSNNVSNGYDFSKSNLVLMVGGQLLVLVLLLMVVMFGTAPLSFPANAVRKMINGNNSR